MSTKIIAYLLPYALKMDRASGQEIIWNNNNNNNILY